MLPDKVVSVSSVSSFKRLLDRFLVRPGFILQLQSRHVAPEVTMQ